MAFVIADRVKETTSTTGTGTLTLSGAVNGFQSFSAIGDGNTTYYSLVHQDGAENEWEVGIGTYTASGTTLARTTILSSSNSGSAVSLSSGVKDVFVTYPSSKAVYVSASPAFVDVSASTLKTTGTVGVGTTSISTNFQSEIKGTAGSTAMPASSGSTQAASAVLRLQSGGGFTGAMDLGSSGTSGGYIQYVNNSNLATNYPLLLNPNGGYVTINSTASTTNALYVDGNIGSVGSLTVDNGSTAVISTFISDTSDAAVIRITNEEGTDHQWDLAVAGSAHAAGEDSFYIRDQTASANRLVIDGSGKTHLNGNVSVTGTLDVLGAVTLNNNLDMQDSDKIVLGTGNDLEIFHDGDHSNIIHQGSGSMHLKSVSNLFLDVAALYVRSYDAGETMMAMADDAAVSLYYDNAVKLATDSAGVDITGTLDLSSHLDMPDSAEIKLGTGDDLVLKHDGTNSSIKNTTGDLYIEDSGGNIYIQAKSGEQSITAFGDGAVHLYHDNNEKIKTTSSGVEVTGDLTASAAVTGADASMRAELLSNSIGDSNVPTTFTNINADYYKWVLPAAGTYILLASWRVRFWDVTGYIKSRLYNTTDSAAVSNSERMNWEQGGDTLQTNVQITNTWLLTVDSADTIHHQALSTNDSTASSIQSDVNGYNSHIWFRIS